MRSLVEDPYKGINGSASGLVWVQRRNGSWWPGKILGPDELPEGSVSNPSSGTPVKLLGKEDSCVDWYNLEKSKRVKAFHCGDYNHCIEKVKASASNSLSKKSSKYSKRDGAILKALELESAFLRKDHPDVNESPPSEDFRKNTNIPKDNSDAEEEGWKRTRGLEDLGMNIARSRKRKITRTLNNQEFSKRKNRRRALTKVLECASSNPNRVALSECNEPFGGLFDVILVAEEKGGSTALTSINSSQQAQVGDHSSHGETSSLVDDGNHESGPTSLGGGPISPRTENDNPEWRSKGKRNSRSRKTDPPDESSREVEPTRPIGQFPDSLHVVPLEVKSSYRSNHVPYVSLASKLTGRSIVGQPLAIEVLDDGSCDGLMCVCEQKPPGGGSRGNKKRGGRKLSRSLKSRKNKGLLSRKTRKLSSLGCARRLSRDKKEPLVLEKVKGPSISCVPLNVVFSRINADLSGSGRPGSRQVVPVV